MSIALTALRDDDEVYPLEEFTKLVMEDKIKDSDGIAYYCMNGGRTTEVAQPSEIKKGNVKHWFGSVVWYRK